MINFRKYNVEAPSLGYHCPCDSWGFYVVFFKWSAIIKVIKK